jgi:predicted kinase
MDWIEGLARGLGEGAEAGAEDRRAVLKLAREVAHRTERVNAPLAAYVVGQYVAARRARGDSADEAVREAARIAEGLLPEPEG